MCLAWAASPKSVSRPCYLVLAGWPTSHTAPLICLPLRRLSCKQINSATIAQFTNTCRTGQAPVSNAGPADVPPPATAASGPPPPAPVAASSAGPPPYSHFAASFLLNLFQTTPACCPGSTAERPTAAPSSTSVVRRAVS